MMSYAVVTPVRNEVENLRRLAACLAEQTVRPLVWLVVDSGSDDETPDVAEELAAKHEWVETLRSDGPGGPTRAYAVVRAFQAGVQALGRRTQIVIKVDADVSVDADYFERLVAAFQADPKLGIASGTCYERTTGEWRQRHVTGDHVWGASRAYRLACWDEVSPLEERLGWDGIDEMKATLRGWRTRTLTHLPFYHHRREGEREGARLHTWKTTGDAAYYLGYRPQYLVLRSLNHARRNPAAVAMMAGYLSAALRREPRIADAAVLTYVRDQQSLRNLPRRMREAFGRRAA
jgi:glycosyltransferase involved in cell wall biosynthesis